MNFSGIIVGKSTPKSTAWKMYGVMGGATHKEDWIM
jgi:hypothetical protein